MATHTTRETFVHPDTGHTVTTDVPASKTDLKARGYVPEGHRALRKAETKPESRPAQPVSKPSTQS